MRQSQEAVKAALADGKMLLEVEFPTTGLSSVSGRHMEHIMAYLWRCLALHSAVVLWAFEIPWNFALLLHTHPCLNLHACHYHQACVDQGIRSWQNLYALMMAASTSHAISIAACHLSQRPLPGACTLTLVMDPDIAVYMQGAQ